MSKSKGKTSKPKLTAFSDEELRLELEARAEAAKKSSIPKPLARPNFQLVKKAVAEEFEHIAETGSSSSDFYEYLFKTVLGSLYGEDVWDWYNKATR